jgi:hypothetical protein
MEHKDKAAGILEGVRGKFGSANDLHRRRWPRYPFIKDCQDSRKGMIMLPKRKIALPWIELKLLATNTIDACN